MRQEKSHTLYHPPDDTTVRRQRCWFI